MRKGVNMNICVIMNNHTETELFESSISNCVRFFWGWGWGGWMKGGVLKKLNTQDELLADILDAATRIRENDD